MVALTCDVCDRDDFPSPRALTAHRASEHGPVLAATRVSVAAASHLTDMDRGAVTVLLQLAATVDAMALRDPDGPLDNVTIPIYLKFADALGLTVAGRTKLASPEVRSGKLAELRALRGGQSVG